MTVDEADVRYGYVGSLVVRSAVYALPVERLHDPFTPALTRLFADRARLARFITDLGLALTRHESRTCSAERVSIPTQRLVREARGGSRRESAR
jgi:hypothetical protein